MKNSAEAFFATPKCLQIFESAQHKIDAAIKKNKDTAGEQYNFLLKFVAETIYYISKYPDEFDTHCIANITSAGKIFVDQIRELSLEHEDLEILFSFCYRFLIEYQLATSMEVTGNLAEMLRNVSDYEYGSRATSQIKYASHQMLIDVVRRYIHHPTLATLKDLPTQIQRSSDEREKSEELLGLREKRVQGLAERLEKYETAFNFVGLVSGFKDMKKTKDEEAKRNFTFLVFLGGLLTLPFLYKIAVTLWVKESLSFDITSALTFVGAELLFIYFFRVALHNFRSIKAQILQIELRMALCQFVQNYAEYAKEAKDSSALLERFEQVVFSGIVSSESAIPSSFDGIEQIAGIIEKFRK